MANEEKRKKSSTNDMNPDKRILTAKAPEENSTEGDKNKTRPNKVDAELVAEIVKKRGRCPSG